MRKTGELKQGRNTRKAETLGGKSGSLAGAATRKTH